MFWRSSLSSPMEMLAFLLAALAIAFVLSKAIGSRKARRAKNASPMRVSGFRGSRSAGLRAAAPEVSRSSALAGLKFSPAPPQPPLVEAVDRGLDWSSGSEGAGKPPVEVLALMFPQTRGVEKQDWKAVKDYPENKKNLDLMLACCKAEIEVSQSNFVFPSPECFKRVTSLLRKQKDYARELGIVELYWQLCDSVFEELKRRDGLRAQLMAQHSALKAGFKKRYDKAQLLLQRKRENAALTTQ